MARAHAIREPDGPAASPTTPTRGRHRLRRWGLVALVLVAVLLVAARAALPRFVKGYVNRTLDEIPGYSGRIADIDIHLWRGAYRIDGLDVVKTDGKVPVPFFSAPRVDLSVQWRELFHGALVGEIEIERPELNFVAGPTEEESQTGVHSSWTDRVEELFPVKINRFRVHDGDLHFRNFHSDPKVDVLMEDVEIEATNLANSREVAKTLEAHLEVRGRPFRGARLVTVADLDPFAEQPTFDVNLELTDVDLRELNDFLKAYANVDVQKGRLSVFAEVAAADGGFHGYVKPLLSDVDVLDLDEKADSPFQKAWEAVVGAVTQVFQNQPRDRFATRVPFRGRLDQPDVGVWATIVGVLRNAFIEALPAKLEDSIEPPKGE